MCKVYGISTVDNGRSINRIDELQMTFHYISSLEVFDDNRIAYAICGADITIVPAHPVYTYMTVLNIPKYCEAIKQSLYKAAIRGVGINEKEKLALLSFFKPEDAALYETIIKEEANRLSKGLIFYSSDYLRFLDKLPIIYNPHKLFYPKYILPIGECNLPIEF